MLAGIVATRLIAQPTGQTLHNHLPEAVASKRAPLVGSLPSEQRINFSIVLPLRNQGDLNNLLVRLYDPSSPDYRKFLSVDQFTERFGPTVDDYQAVVSFARRSGFQITGTPANRLVVPVNGTAAQINRALHVNMSLYHHPSEDRTFFSPDREPSLELTVPVAHIAGLNNFSVPRPMVKRPQQAVPFLGAPTSDVTGTGPGGSYLASDMRAAYYGGNTLDGNGQVVGLLEFGGYDLSDVNDTFNNAGQSYSVPVNDVLLDGATEGSGGYDDAEQVLDIVQAIGMAPGLSQVRVYIGIGSDDANILNSMASENIAKAISCSWGWMPEDPGSDDPFFKEFAAQGQSFFAASGDDGAFDSAISPYFYPGEDANVTAVGGTHLTTGSAGGAWSAETAWNSGGYGSGGGVSPDGIAIPSWQAGLATSANGGSKTLRNVPDVAMEGDFDNYSCALGQCYTDFAGTSFAAPRWAGFLALVNQQAVEAGKAPACGIGSLNPAIYAIGKGANYAKDFHDITAGNNDTQGQPTWFNAVSGYDLVTGWGSATGQDLIDDLAGKQVPGFWIGASSPTLTMLQGGSATTTLSIAAADGFTGNVLYALSALPTGVTASFSSNPTSGSTVLTIKASATAVAQTTTLTLKGTSGSLSATRQLTVVVHGPTFTLASLPTSLVLNPGSSVSSTITLTPEYGFTGQANLSVSGLPSGVTASFSSTTTATTSTLTLKSTSSATLGISNLTINGTSGALKVTTLVPLTVAKPNFILEGNPSLNMGQGTTAVTYISVGSEYGFTGNVNFAVTGLPTGVTASFSPNPTNGTTGLALVASSTATLGAKTITITGTAGTLTASMTVALDILTPAFTISGPTAVDIGQGTTNNLVLTVNAEYGFSGNVSLAVSGLPAGVTAAFSPNPTTGYTTLTLTASNTVALGTYTVRVTGTAGKLSSTATFSLGVFTPTFTLSNPGTVDVGQGTSAVTYLYVIPQYGFPGYVSLSVSGLPTGVTAAFSPNPSAGYAYTLLTLTASATAPLGTSSVTITGVSNNIRRTVPLTLEIFQPTFSLSSQGQATVGQGSSIAASVSVNPEYGFTGSVNLSASGLPTGVTASFSPNPTSGQSVMTLNASNAAALGTHPITITGSSGTGASGTGTSGKLTATTTLSLATVAPAFTLTTNQPSLTMDRSSSATATVTVNPEYGFTGSANLTVTGLPSGMGATFSPNPTNGSAVVTFTTNYAATLGAKTVTITGTSGKLTASTTLTVNVQPASFTISAGAMVLGQGSSTTSEVYVSPLNGFSGAIHFSVSGLPAGVTATVLPDANYGTILTVTASNTAAIGTTNGTITGTCDGLTASTTFPLSIYAPSFTLGSQGDLTMGQGTTQSSYFFFYANFGFAGSVNLTVSGLPSGVTASFSPNPTTDSSVMTLTASSTAALGTWQVTVTGTSGTKTSSTTFYVTVLPQTFLIGDAYPVTLVPGQTVTTYIYVNPQNGFSGSVKLAITGLPSGVTASFSPNPTTGQAALTLTASSTAAPVTATPTITGTSGSQTSSATLPLSIVQPSFTLSTAGTVVMSQNSYSRSYVYVNGLNGFSGNVTLAISGLPSGVAATLSPNPTSGQSQLTLAANNASALGTKTLTITGTSGTQKITTSLILTVNPPAFTIQADGLSTLLQGGSSNTDISIQSETGFTGSVNLAISGLPSGVTGTFGNNPTAGGYSSLILKATSTASPGEYTAIVTGTSGSESSSTTLQFTVAAPGFTVIGVPYDLSLARGTTSYNTLTLRPQTGFTGSVSFSISGLPSGVTAYISPNPSTGTTALNLAATSTAALGQYTATLVAKSGTQTSSYNFSINIVIPTFSISEYGNNFLYQGATATEQLQIDTQTGFTGSVNLAVSGLPSGVTASFSPNPFTSYSELTFNASASAAPGEYSVIVTGTSGTQTASTTFVLGVLAPTFSIYSYDVTLGRGSSTTAVVSVNAPYGYTPSIRFGISGLPSGVTASISPNPTTSGQTTVTFQAASTASLGQYNVTVTGTSGSQSSSVTFPITIYPASFTITAQGVGSMGLGTTATSYVTVTPQFGFAGQVNLSVSGLPSGVTGSFASNPTSSQSNLNLTASKTAALGEYNVTVTGTSGGLSSTSTFPLSIYAPTFTLSTGYVYLNLGASQTSYVAVSPLYGFTGNVALSVSGLPTGVTASISPNPTSTGSSELTLTAGSTAVPGTYNLTLNGVSGATASSTNFTLILSQ